MTPPDCQSGSDVPDSLLRELTPQVLGALVRRYGHFDACEDAVQEALLAASRRWRTDGVPRRPRAWLIQVAARKLTDLLRAEQARRRREDTVAARVRPDDRVEPPAGTQEDGDDTLVLMLMCAHPALSRTSQIALTLRAVAGLGSTEIARALLTSEATTTRRITRAKRAIQESGVPFRLPPRTELPDRLATVRQVLYLIFTEGYAATSGPDLNRPELAAEAIRLAELLHGLLPDDSEVAGLLALMLLTDARAPARTGDDGELIPMAEQDRAKWKATSIRRGVELISCTLPRGQVGPYQLQAAIAAVHDEAPSTDETDWPQIVALYELLITVSDTPVVRLNHAAAVAMARGAAAGMELLDALDDARLARDHRLHGTRAHLLEMSGDRVGARAAYEKAARCATNLRHARHLHARAQRLDEG